MYTRITNETLIDKKVLESILARFHRGNLVYLYSINDKEFIAVYAPTVYNLVINLVISNEYDRIQILKINQSIVKFLSLDEYFYRLITNKSSTREWIDHDRVIIKSNIIDRIFRILLNKNASTDRLLFETYCSILSKIINLRKYVNNEGVFKEGIL